MDRKPSQDNADQTEEKHNQTEQEKMQDNKQQRRAQRNQQQQSGHQKKKQQQHQKEDNQEEKSKNQQMIQSEETEEKKIKHQSQGEDNLQNQQQKQINPHQQQKDKKKTLDIEEKKELIGSSENIRLDQQIIQQPKHENIEVAYEESNLHKWKSMGGEVTSKKSMSEAMVAVEVQKIHSSRQFQMVSRKSQQQFQTIQQNFSTITQESIHSSSFVSSSMMKTKQEQKLHSYKSGNLQDQKLNQRGVLIPSLKDQCQSEILQSKQSAARNFLMNKMGKSQGKAIVPLTQCLETQSEHVEIQSSFSSVTYYQVYSQQMVTNKTDQTVICHEVKRESGQNLKNMGSLIQSLKNQSESQMNQQSAVKSLVISQTARQQLQNQKDKLLQQLVSSSEGHGMAIVPLYYPLKTQKSYEHVQVQQNFSTVTQPSVHSSSFVRSSMMKTKREEKLNSYESENLQNQKLKQNESLIQSLKAQCQSQIPQSKQSAVKFPEIHQPVMLPQNQIVGLENEVPIDVPSQKPEKIQKSNENVQISQNLSTITNRSVEKSSIISSSMVQIQQEPKLISYESENLQSEKLKEKRVLIQSLNDQQQIPQPKSATPLINQPIPIIQNQIAALESEVPIDVPSQKPEKIQKSNENVQISQNLSTITNRSVEKSSIISSSMVQIQQEPKLISYESENLQSEKLKEKAVLIQSLNDQQQIPQPKSAIPLINQPIPVIQNQIVALEREVPIDVPSQKPEKIQKSNENVQISQNLSTITNRSVQRSSIISSSMVQSQQEPKLISYESENLQSEKLKEKAVLIQSLNDQQQIPQPKSATPLINQPIPVIQNQIVALESQIPIEMSSEKSEEAQKSNKNVEIQQVLSSQIQEQTNRSLISISQRQQTLIFEELRHLQGKNLKEKVYLIHSLKDQGEQSIPQQKSVVKSILLNQIVQFQQDSLPQQLISSIESQGMTLIPLQQSVETQKSKENLQIQQHFSAITNQYNSSIVRSSITTIKREQIIVSYEFEKVQDENVQEGKLIYSIKDQIEQEKTELKLPAIESSLLNQMAKQQLQNQQENLPQQIFYSDNQGVLIVPSQQPLHTSTFKNENIQIKQISPSQSYEQDNKAPIDVNQREQALIYNELQHLQGQNMKEKVFLIHSLNDQGEQQMPQSKISVVKPFLLNQIARQQLQNKQDNLSQQLISSIENQGMSIIPLQQSVETVKSHEQAIITHQSHDSFSIVRSSDIGSKQEQKSISYEFEQISSQNLQEKGGSLIYSLKDQLQKEKSQLKLSAVESSLLSQMAKQQLQNQQENLPKQIFYSNNQGVLIVPSQQPVQTLESHEHVQIPQNFLTLAYQQVNRSSIVVSKPEEILISGQFENLQSKNFKEMGSLIPYVINQQLISQSKPSSVESSLINQPVRLPQNLIASPVSQGEILPINVSVQQAQSTEQSNKNGQIQQISQSISIDLPLQQPEAPQSFISNQMARQQLQHQQENLLKQSIISSESQELEKIQRENFQKKGSLIDTLNDQLGQEISQQKRSAMKSSIIHKMASQQLENQQENSTLAIDISPTRYSSLVQRSNQRQHSPYPFFCSNSKQSEHIQSVPPQHQVPFQNQIEHIIMQKYPSRSPFAKQRTKVSTQIIPIEATPITLSLFHSNNPSIIDQLPIMHLFDRNYVEPHQIPSRESEAESNVPIDVPSEENEVIILQNIDFPVITPSISIPLKLPSDTSIDNGQKQSQIIDQPLSRYRHFEKYTFPTTSCRPMTTHTLEQSKCDQNEQNLEEFLEKIYKVTGRTIKKQINIDLRKLDTNKSYKTQERLRYTPHEYISDLTYEKQKVEDIGRGKNGNFIGNVELSISTSKKKNQRIDKIDNNEYQYMPITTRVQHMVAPISPKINVNYLSNYYASIPNSYEERHYHEVKDITEKQMRSPFNKKKLSIYSPKPVKIVQVNVHGSLERLDKNNKPIRLRSRKKTVEGEMNWVDKSKYGSIFEKDRSLEQKSSPQRHHKLTILQKAKSPFIENKPDEQTMLHQEFYPFRMVDTTLQQNISYSREKGQHRQKIKITLRPNAPKRKHTQPIESKQQSEYNFDNCLPLRDLFKSNVKV